jgi:hypothetical protein
MCRRDSKKKEFTPISSMFSGTNTEKSYRTTYINGIAKSTAKMPVVPSSHPL